MASQASAETAPEEARCRVCRASPLLPRYTKPFGTLAECPRCHLLLLLHREGERSNPRIQQESFGVDWVEQRRQQQRIIHREAQHRLRDIRRYVSRGHLLEVGCGTGELLVVAAKQGFDVAGIDSSAEALEFARVQFGLQKLYPTLESLPGANPQFDVVVMSHVLEHLYYPLEVLQRIHALLRPNGILYLAVPNLDDWGVRLLGEDWPNFHPAHTMHFTLPTLSRLLAEAGFTVLGRGRPATATLAVSVLDFIKFKILRRKEPLPDVAPRAVLSSGQRLSLKTLHASARVALLVLTIALYPLGILQMRWGKTGELAVLATKTSAGASPP